MRKLTREQKRQRLRDVGIVAVGDMWEGEKGEELLDRCCDICACPPAATEHCNIARCRQPPEFFRARLCHEAGRDHNWKLVNAPLGVSECQNCGSRTTLQQIRDLGHAPQNMILTWGQGVKPTGKPDSFVDPQVKMLADTEGGKTS